MIKFLLILFLIAIITTGCNTPLGSLLPAQDDLTEAGVSQKFNASQIKNKYKLNGVSLSKRDIKNAELDKYKKEPKDEIEVIVGDKPTGLGAINQEFRPTIEMRRWNEVGFKLTPINNELGASNVQDKNKKLNFVGDKIVYENSKAKYEMYENGDEYKYVWYLKKKPASNVIEFQIDTEGLDFFYQPPLTEEYKNGYSKEFKKEIVVTETQVKDLDGNILVERPENVVGSYAVYHSTKGGMNDKDGKEYKTGKAFQIYRPHIIDANGNETWGILKIENGIYSVEIPQEFLDTCNFPIFSNDTFGYTTIGGSWGSWSTDRWISYVASSPSDASGGTDITAYVWGFSSDCAFKGVMVLAGSSTIITNGVGNAIVNGTASAAWQTSTFGVSPTLSANTSYWIGIVVQSTNADQYVAYDSGGSSTLKYELDNSYSSPTDPSGVTTGDDQYSIYATYTPSGGGGGTPEERHVRSPIIFD